jgi:AraC family transcriptional regulator, regulatory protein of adaptative response / DNA-3-methyladenine glycosylase II
VKPHHLDLETCYRAAASRDARFDGWFSMAVTSTGIYCRPSCPAVMPKRENVRIYPTAAAAQTAGFRACRRCRPDASPGSPEWDARADAVGRAMRLVRDGVVDRDGVDGLAHRLGYSPRHLHRLLLAEVGAGPLTLARAQRAQTARVLLETTDLPAADVAFASGFGSVRQFNDTVREVFATTPTGLRQRRGRGIRGEAGSVVLRLPYREPLDAGALLDFLAARAVPGVEHVDATSYTRALALPHGPGTVTLTPDDGFVRCVLRLHDLRDLGTATARCRRLLDLDADPVGLADALGDDPTVGPLVRLRPGLRLPGSVDAAETAVRAVLGQQVSVAAARTVAGRLATRYGTPLPHPVGEVVRTFPAPDSLTRAEDADLPMPRRRADALRTLCGALADGDLVLDPGVDRDEAARALRALPSVGPWTASYVLLRGLGDPDAFPASDLGLRHAVRGLGLPHGSRDLDTLAARWRPFRSYAAQHLWTHLTHEEAAA